MAANSFGTKPSVSPKKYNPQEIIEEAINLLNNTHFNTVDNDWIELYNNNQLGFKKYRETLQKPRFLISIDVRLNENMTLKTITIVYKHPSPNSETDGGGFEGHKFNADDLIKFKELQMLIIDIANKLSEAKVKKSSWVKISEKEMAQKLLKQVMEIMEIQWNKEDTEERIIFDRRFDKKPKKIILDKTKTIEVTGAAKYFL